MSKIREVIDGNPRNTYFAYDDDNRITRIRKEYSRRNYTYDAFGRISQKDTEHTYGDGKHVLTENYTYFSPDSDQTSTLVSQFRSTSDGNHDVTYTYTYDGNGNILSVGDGTHTTRYVYDSANQLIRENNQASGKTTIWTYDSGGNIKTRKEYAYTTGTVGTATDTVTYTYGNTAWGDLLTKYDGQTITYDGMGNPTSYYNGTRWTMEWEHGRELRTISDGSATWTNTYNADGLRIRRTDGTNTYNYVYLGGQLVKATYNDTAVMYFAYDAEGRPMSVKYNGTTYYYVTNLQGDVVGIVNQSGNKIVSYTYDAWGNLLSTTGSSANTLGKYNPLRYRGYVFDRETGLYYVSSRYYDPEIGRFINADDVDYLGAGSNLTSYNLFAYCGNNPVMGYDPTGHWDWGGVIAGLGIIAGTVITVATFGIGSPIGAIIAGAAIATGAVTTYAAATDSTMVVDLSYSKQVLPNYYVKGGGSVVIDFKNDNANFYPHIGFGKGYSDGLSYSVGMVDNYEHPDDYAKHFIDINVGYNAGFDHCWNPLEKHDSATQATAVTFSSGGSYGVGYDYYFGPKQILAW